MNSNIAKILILSVVLSLFSCCNDDEKKEEHKGIDSTYLTGEWYRTYSNYVEDVNFTSNLRFTGVVYEELSSTPKIADHISGSWGLDSYGSILVIRIYRSSTGNEEDKYYSVGSWNNYMLQLMDKKYGNPEQYLRIVETLNLDSSAEGDIVFFKRNSISAKGYSSSNPSIATVDSLGHVTANGVGVAFITVSTSVGTLIVKVVVQ